MRRLRTRCRALERRLERIATYRTVRHVVRLVLAAFVAHAVVFSFTDAGGFCACAAFARDPNDALCVPDTTKPLSARHVEAGTFHCAAAAATSISRAMAPTWR